MDKRLSIYSENDLAQKIKNLEKDQDKYLDKDNLDKVFFIRCDGRAFKNFTKGLKKPFDVIFRETMERTMIDICSEVQGACLGFTQSDEITIMFKKETETSDVFFGGRVVKIVSEVASIATLRFNVNFMEVVKEYINKDIYDGKSKTYIEEVYKIYEDKFLTATFDARVFEIDKEFEYEPIIWRVLDCYKNAVQMISRCNFSQKELHKKNLKDMEEMLLEKNIKLSDFEPRNLYGKACIKEPIVLYEGTDRECTRKKWVRKDILDILFENI